MPNYIIFTRSKENGALHQIGSVVATSIYEAAKTKIQEIKSQLIEEEAIFAIVEDTHLSFFSAMKSPVLIWPEGSKEVI